MIDIDDLDINRLNPDQLVQLNARIVERLRQLNAMSTLKSMTQLHLGQRVCFDHGGTVKTGTLIKFNQKSVVVLTDDQQRWKISPELLMPVLEENPGRNVQQMR